MEARQWSRRIHQAPEWGIEPVPPGLRRLGFLDQAVLWGNLGVSLLVLVAGALLVPALGLWPALGATVVGAVAGNALLGLAAVPAAATGGPAMVLYRAPLGVRGSLLPTACNVVQNLGWATFELFVIASTAYLTWYALTRFDLGALAGQAGQGGLSFWAGVDLAIALPISWVPLVADYARFGRSAGATFWGTAVGYLLARYENFLFLLGALFVPLFGVLAADWYVLARRRYDVAAMYRPDGPYGGVRWPAVLAWVLGFLVYNWITPGTVPAWVSLTEALFGGLLPLPFPLSARLPWLGASIPAFLVAFLAMLAVGRRSREETVS